jgi:hypothetical protein
MACQISLFQQLTGSGISTNGNWFMDSTMAPISGAQDSDIVGVDWQVGGDPTVSPGDPLQNTNQTLSSGNQIGSGNALWIDVTDVAPGDYYFVYVVGDLTACGAKAVITVTVVEGADAGVAATGLTFCSNDNTAYNIFNTFIDPDPNTIGNVDTDGTWTGDGLLSGGYSDNGTPGDPTDDTFTPSTANLNNQDQQTWEFTYTVTVTGDPNCDECTDVTTVSVTVAAVANAGSDGAITACSQPAAP